MQTNNVIKSAAVVIALYLPLLSYPAEAGTDTPRYNYVRPIVPHYYYVRPKRSPGFNNGEAGTATYGANTRADTGSFDVPGAQYPDVRE